MGWAGLGVLTFVQVTFPQECGPHTNISYDLGRLHTLVSTTGDPDDVALKSIEKLHDGKQ